MLLTISTTHQPASDLGFLLHKHPDRVQRFELAFGEAHVFYPELDETRCTAALLLEIDPVALVRSYKGSARLLEHYVNDRPYVASSFMSVAIGRVLRSALNGRCDERAELVDTPIALEASLSVLPVRGGEPLLRRLFEPLGYTLSIEPVPLDETQPQWGGSVYYALGLSATKRLSELLAHLYVLIPVLDKEKHYWVGDAEVDKLLHHGADWLPEHPERELIARRYLKFRRSLARLAIERMEEDEGFQPEAHDAVAGEDEAVLEKPLSLNERRMQDVVAVLREFQVRSVVDLGCGEGKLLRALLKEKAVARILGMDVSARALEIAHERLHLDRMPELQRRRIDLIQGSLTYRDRRLEGFEAATLIEVIEHIDAERLDALEKVVFKYARPALVLVSTPNREYNRRFAGLAPGRLRHADHRFEWTRLEFETWARDVAGGHGYRVGFRPIGEVDAELGAPTQMAVFELESSA